MELKHTIAALTLAILFILSCWTSPVAAEDPASPPPPLNPPSIVNVDIKFTNPSFGIGEKFDDFYQSSEDARLKPKTYIGYEFVGYHYVCEPQGPNSYGFTATAQYNLTPYLPDHVVKEQLDAGKTKNNEWNDRFAELDYSAGPGGSLKSGEETKYFFVKDNDYGLTKKYNLRFQDLDNPQAELGGYQHPTPVADPGYRFIGWKLSGGVTDSGAVMNSDVQAVAQFVKDPPPVESTPIEPVRREQLFAITFDANGGIFPNGQTQITYYYSPNTVISIADAPFWAGHTFLSWDGPWYNPGDQYTVTKDYTFKARWSSNDEAPLSPAAPISKLPSTGSVNSVFPILLSLGFAAMGILLKKHR